MIHFQKLYEYSCLLISPYELYTQILQIENLLFLFEIPLKLLIMLGKVSALLY